MRNFAHAHIITRETHARPIGWPGPRAQFLVSTSPRTLCSDLRVLCVSRCISGSSQPFQLRRATLATPPQPTLAPVPRRLQTEVVTRSSIPLKSLWLLAAFALLFGPWPIRAQESAPPAKPADTSADKPATPETPAQLELLETHIRFEANGDFRKEVHTRVRINSELGVRQFSHLNFNFNRSFEQIEIPLVHITHASGGTADILPSAITDQPNPAADLAAYQDVRVKSVRILGLEPADVLEYRVVTIATHPPLAPDFWLDHSFDRTGVVSEEIFELDLPANSFVPTAGLRETLPTPPNSLSLKSPTDIGQIRISPQAPEPSKTQAGEGAAARLVYRWKLNFSGHF